MNKKISTPLFLCFLISLFLLFPLWNNPFIFAQMMPQDNLAAHQSGELLVKLKNSEQIYKFKFANETELNGLIKFYQAQKEVEYAEPNYLYQATLIPNDLYFSQQNYLEKIQAPNAWNITTGTRKSIIAIIDSGVDIDHPDLKNNIWTNEKETPGNGIDDDENGFTDDINGWDFLANNNDPRPKLILPYTDMGIKHGTVVAGVAASEGGNGQGIAGIAWHARIMSLRVLDGEGAGDTLTVAKAIDYARLMKSDIINLSFVGEGNSQTLEAAIKKANDAGILIIAAAGNEVKDGIDMDLSPRYPVCQDGPNGENFVIGVASIDNYNAKASFSNFGSKCIDIAAPGVSIFSTVYHNENNEKFKKFYESGWTGTSVSAPQIAGAVALIKSLRPELLLTQIKKLLLNNADDIDTFNPGIINKFGHGRLNVLKTISNAIIETIQEPTEIKKIITLPATGAGPLVRIYKKNQLENQFFAYDEKFRSAFSITGGNFNSTDAKEIIVGLGQGTYPWVKIFSENGSLNEKISVYAENFRGGVEVTLGDVDGDGVKEIITAPGSSGGPHIRIFDINGQLKNQFFAFDKNERVGLEIAVADIDADNIEDIIVIRKRGVPEIRIFSQNGTLKYKFLAYDKNFRGSFHLAGGDLNHDGSAEIIVSTGAGLEPQIKIFNSEGILKSSFLAYDRNFRGGVYVAIGDIDADGEKEIVTGAGASGGPQVRVFNSLGALKFQFFAYDKNFRGGVKVAVEK
ncbi:hypothetical protein COX27_01045 [Candidatus Kuenenbacteria bacterium CG23_combo_of_CG06-09_8_20_14_all_36_9]|uniref:Peptidase S8/S53 domain-containing protein n=1 Tax=Candidatus Kuenenbacteria bacterium CG10_big_fil_rev_8_21_14_0_10_36_11 TaxID=1974618 RepID=A0A2M6WAX4_9BACT|nr:MAG: hypothetical protein COX27_01045 [Candidatus Kuenenbacteria bacterium CG23_combo_of_CG06-09_8_20_14_all_36_9]PIT89921.1 MAG: hypothetical protein COU23_01280 [Candidatus Kuenenbacteria bacterium CG10_big_fil_rev_8_21_14_0_10_36_11]